MQNTLKIAISLPVEDFKKIEKIRKESKIGRSSLIDKAISFWLKHLEEEELIRRYEDGYKKHPESAKEIHAMEIAAAQAFSEEGLE